MLAVALTVALMIVVDSLFSGLIDGISKSIRDQSGDLILDSRYKPIPQYNTFIKKLEELKEVEGAAPYALDGGILWFESGDVRQAVLEGVDIEIGGRFFDWKKTLLRQKDAAGPVDFSVPGFPDANGVWVGVNVIAEPNEKTEEYDLEKIREFLGKEVILTTKSADLNRRTLRLRISDIVFTETFYGDQRVYLPFDFLHNIQTESQSPPSAGLICVKFSKGSNFENAQRAIADVWVKFAQEQLGWPQDDIWRLGFIMPSKSGYLQELTKQLGILMLIFGVISSVAILLVFCIFYMIVETKLKDIAIIKSCGAGSSAVALIFTAFGGTVGLAGAILGIAAGYLITININIIERYIHIIFGIKLWLQSSYILNFIPNTVNWPDVLPIVVASIAGCCLGAIIPSIVAARTRPIEILRYE